MGYFLQERSDQICDIGGAREGWAEDYAETHPGSALGHVPVTRDGHSVGYDLDFARGDRLLREAIAAADEASGHASGRIQRFIAPAQVDTCSEGQIREAARATAGSRSRSMRPGPSSSFRKP